MGASAAPEDLGPGDGLDGPAPPVERGQGVHGAVVWGFFAGSAVIWTVVRWADGRPVELGESTALRWARSAAEHGFRTALAGGCLGAGLALWARRRT